MDATYKVRNPLQTRVDYKGFRALATAVMPIDPSLGMSLGFDSEGRLHNLDNKLRTELSYVADVLNLDETKTRIKKSNIEQTPQNDEKLEIDIQLFESLPLSNFIKVYEQADGFNQSILSSSHSHMQRIHKSVIRNSYIE
jgi:hypothetical protein